ncbi:MAG: hypothetical protein II842_00940 [Butyrivibrio sp.]|nr:hypothetical protein [Butyrivibrio sp.]
MRGNSFRLVPKMIDNVTFGIWAVDTSGYCKQIGAFNVPNDGQMNDNLEAAQAICDVLKKRIRKSV